MGFNLKKGKANNTQSVPQNNVPNTPTQNNPQTQQPSPSIQQQQYQQQFVNTKANNTENKPVFTQTMYQQMQQLLQLEKQGTIQPQQAQYLNQLKQRYMAYQTYRNNTQGMGNPNMSANMQPNATMQMEQMQDISPNNEGDNTKKKKKLPIIPIILGIILLLVIAGFVKTKLGSSNNNDNNISYEQTGRYVIDSVVTALNTDYDAETLDTIIGAEQGDSYLGQELAYVNNVPLRVEFLKKVGSMVSVQYPSTIVTDKKGNIKSETESNMLNGEACTITIPDYAALANQMDNDADVIKKLYTAANISPETTYTYQNDWFDLFCQYFVDYADVPTVEKEITFNIGLSVDNTYYLKDDIDIDQLLFSSDEFHHALDKFSQICIDYTGYKEEIYTEQELVHNDEYDEWFNLFIQYFTADGGVYDPDTNTFSNVEKAFHKGVSKWEPWFVRDENNVIQTDEDGNRIVNYFSVKDENGKDWIQPAEEIWKDTEKTRQVDDPWEDERGIWYNNCGTYYLENIYNGKGITIFCIGDGSIDNPAGVGTPIITHVMDTNGEYHDVEVTLLAYWTGQNAIDYVQKFDTRNRGFNVQSVVQLIAYEIQVRNLDGDEYTFNSEMSLCDRNSNTASRTGTMYSFSKDIPIKAGETIIINDWANSTELQQKYVVWGKSFSRTYPYIYFRILAGEGNVPTYSAYDYFVTTQAQKSSEEVQTTENSITN